MGQKSGHICTFRDKTRLKITSFRLILDPFWSENVVKWTHFQGSGTIFLLGRKVLSGPDPWARLAVGPEIGGLDGTSGPKTRF